MSDLSTFLIGIHIAATIFLVWLCVRIECERARLDLENFYLKTPQEDSETTLEQLVDLFTDYREFFGLTNSEFPDDKPQHKQCDYEEKFLSILCEYYGHDIGPDQCGKPEHDYCYRCMRRRVDIEQEVKGE